MNFYQNRRRDVLVHISSLIHREYLLFLYRLENKIHDFICLPQSQFVYISWTLIIAWMVCGVWILAWANYLAMMTILILLPLIMARTDPPPRSLAVMVGLLILSTVQGFFSILNRCPMDLWSAWLVLIHHHLHWQQLSLHQPHEKE